MLQLHVGLRLGLGPGNGVFHFFFFFFSSLLFFLSQTSWCMGPVCEGTPREDPGTSVGNTGHPSHLQCVHGEQLGNEVTKTIPTTVGSQRKVSLKIRLSCGRNILCTAMRSEHMRVNLRHNNVLQAIFPTQTMCVSAI